MLSKGYKILYTPEVKVSHHRRTIFQPFAHQFYHYGLDKGRLARTPGNITYIWHAASALFTLYFIAALIVGCLPISGIWKSLALSPAAATLVIFLIESIRQSRSLIEVPATVAAFFLGHFSYGTGYLIGLATGRPDKK